MENSFMGAEDCASRCFVEGFEYWGLECPTLDAIHCQCLEAGILSSATLLDDQKCRQYNNENPATHCVGPFSSSMHGVEYLHGAAYISSAYLTKKSGW